MVLELHKRSERTMDTILQEIKRKAPFYVPEWNAEDNEDFGIALSMIFANMTEIISNNLNYAPQKHFVSFLDMMNFSLMPAQPAKTALTFVLSKAASENILIPIRTQVTAESTDNTPVFFETEKSIIATPSHLVCI